MIWLLMLAVFVFGGFLFLSGHLFFGLLVGFIGLLTLVRHILRAVRKAIWLAIRKPLAIALAIVLIAMAATAVPILWGVKSQPDNKCDYLIVLGAGVDADTPSPILQDRIDAAYAYLTAHPDTVCIATGGKGDDENISEARCIYNHLTALGIAADRIWLEERATSTVENFEYSLALLEEKTGGIDGNLGVLSSEFHLFRASLISKENGLKPIFIAAPTGKIFVRINYTVREIIVLWNYLITGG